MQDTKNIAFVGLGSMGLPMATNLVNAGYTVKGVDTRKEAMDALVTIGGKPAESLKDACGDAAILVLMVVNAAQARTVLVDAGALEALPQGAHVCLMATCPPDEVQKLATDVANSGKILVDAPVSGGVVGAKAGTLTIMVGAPRADYDAVAPVLRTMGDKLFHCGPEQGQGAVVKAINQLLCGVHLAAAGEALALGEKAGVDTATLLEIVSGSAASSWMLKDRGPRMLMEHPPVTSAVDIFVKDLGIALAAGRSVSMGLPLAAAAHQMFLGESGAGNGFLDDSQVIAAYRRLNGIP
ncbi:NAD(P)-dependent oxidoreductase [Rhizobium sp. TRM96647]|uniref:NAD(P)-dependent oxidoreductase n=1 Tax=unclassified Rhizobium TaxID=2613769 RepID=UPI0021E8BABB|nr:MULTISPECIES: NAD(P)-dependent oxidoreductase [unclassified Rhizobium]MCV3738856.1 NAD(P)-dependent oxidoreductase [Rhizobium sp. TRM96647]MCV3760437.1 NAD(P)-dependent oxidoreductase [Rhizobium sp. TRM96650]